MKINLQGLHKSFRQGEQQIELARALNWQLDSARSAAIVGPSGSGKSTLLNMLAGIEPADQGTINIGEYAVHNLTEQQLAEWRARHVGLVFQQFHLMPYLTARENIALGLALASNHSWQEVCVQADQWLEKIKLGARVDHLPSQLSGGEKQRVAIARALIKNPGLILADEPTGNLDIHTGSAIMDLLLDLQTRTGATLVLITHDQAMARRCQAQWTLEEGMLRPC